MAKISKLLFCAGMVSCFCLFSFVKVLNGQAARFNAGIVAGFAGSQIEGDFLAGYHKLGLTAGLKAVIYLSEKTELNFELLFAENGSLRRADDFVPFSSSINLKYVKIPILFHYKDWYHEDDYYRVHFLAGPYYGYLINSSVENFTINPDNFNKNEWGFTLGVEYFINQHIGFGLRYERAMSKLWKSSANPDFELLIPYNLTFQGIYLF